MNNKLHLLRLSMSHNLKRAFSPLYITLPHYLDNYQNTNRDNPHLLQYFQPIFKFKLSFLFHTLVLSASVSVYANNETKNQLSKSCHTKKDIININPPKNNQLLPFSIPLQNKISPTSTNNNFISYFPSFFKGHYNIYW